jgi:hypothetical protein
MNLRRLIAILHPRLAVVAHDLAMIWLAWYGTNWLRWNLQIDPPPVSVFGPEYAIVLVAQTVILAWTGLYRGLWRFASLPDLWNIARASVLGALAIALGLFFLDRLEGTPRSVLLMVRSRSCCCSARRAWPIATGRTAATTAAAHRPSACSCSAPAGPARPWSATCAATAPTASSAFLTTNPGCVAPMCMACPCSVRSNNCRNSRAKSPRRWS